MKAYWKLKILWSKYSFSPKLKICRGIAKFLYFLRIKYGCSTDIVGNTSRGYGKLDPNGFWQFPLYKKDLKER